MLYTARIGSTLHIYDDQTAVSLEKILRRQAVRTGEAIHWPTGISEWYEWDEVVDVSKSGAAQYTWDKTGNKILHHLMKIELRDGHLTRTVVKKQFRAFE